MLKVLRRRKSMLWIVLGVFVVPFVLWGITDYLAARQRGGLYAGTVYGRPVPLQQYRAAWDATRHRAVLTFGERALQSLTPTELERQTWDRLALCAEAHRARIRVADREVVAELNRWPLFQRDGRFDWRTYEMVVRYSLGATPRIFEEEVRDQLAIKKLFEQATRSLAVSDEELRSAHRQEAEAARFAYLLLEPNAFAATVAVGDDELRASFAQHAQEFRSEPKVQVRYLAIEPNHVSRQLAVAEHDLLEEYLRQVPEGERGTPPTDQRREAIRQQLLDARARERMADLAWELRAQWKRTPDLAALGAAHGLTPRDTPPFARGEKIAGVPDDPEFTEAAFALNAGEISRTVETPASDYLLTLVKEYPPRPLPFDEARDKVRAALVEHGARRLAREAAHNLHATASEVMASGAHDPLNAAAKAAGLEVSRTEFVTRTGWLGAHESAGALLGPAFTLEEGQLGGPWETPKGWVIAQLTARKPADEEEFLKAKDRLRTQILERKRATALDAWLRQLRDHAKPTPNPQLTAIAQRQSR